MPDSRGRGNDDNVNIYAKAGRAVLLAQTHLSVFQSFPPRYRSGAGSAGIKAGKQYFPNKKTRKSGQRSGYFCRHDKVVVVVGLGQEGVGQGTGLADPVIIGAAADDDAAGESQSA